MTTDHGFPADCAALTRLLFPDGVLALWSPTLVFYDQAGGIDCDRLLAHLDFMAPHAKGIPVPGDLGAWIGLGAGRGRMGTGRRPITDQGRHAKPRA
jgi:hypothetical protein